MEFMDSDLTGNHPYIIIISIDTVVEVYANAKNHQRSESQKESGTTSE